MKLGIFTDSHYSSHEITCEKRYNSRSLEKIKEAYALFEKEKCDLAICLGDLTDKEDTLETVNIILSGTQNGKTHICRMLPY